MHKFLHLFSIIKVKEALVNKSIPLPSDFFQILPLQASLYNHSRSGSNASSSNCNCKNKNKIKIRRNHNLITSVDFLESDCFFSFPLLTKYELSFD